MEFQLSFKVNEKIYLRDPETSEIGKQIVKKAIDLIFEIGFEQFTFKKLRHKAYAIAVFHDLNSNGVLDKNPLGIPLEPYGFSRNARNTFSAPSFGQASFTHSKTQTISITVR